MPRNYVKKTDNPRMGRPRIEIDQAQFEKLCGIQCTEEEIASWFHCSIETLECWVKRVYKTTFLDIYKSLSGFGKISLRRTQFKIAEHNCSMAIFLGKQYLGQRDVIENNVTANGMLDEIHDYMKKKAEQ